MKTFIAGLSSLLTVAAVPQYGYAPTTPMKPAMMSLCDKYTTALLMNNTAENQKTVLTLIVNTAIIGNYTTMPGSLVAVPGILAPGTGDFEGVNLGPYFAGGLTSSNPAFHGATENGMGIAVNFLDGGGAEPLKMNMPAADMTSNQYRLVSHLYPYFASLLGCSLFGNTVEPYPGPTSMYEVHKYMALDDKEIGWFVTQVGKSAASFGVSSDDVATVGKALLDTFGMKCSPPASVPPTAAPMLQAICIEPTCPEAAMPACESYGPVIEPMPAM